MSHKSLLCSLLLLLLFKATPSTQGQVYVVEAPTNRQGAVWTAEVAASGALIPKAHIGRHTGGFGHLDQNAEFGRKVISLGDLNGDGRTEVLVGEQFDRA